MLQTLVDEFPNVVFVNQICPSYVEMYTKINEEIVLAFMKTKIPDSAKIRTKGDKVTVSEESDTTGSPLRLDLSVHIGLDDPLTSHVAQIWRKEEAFHAPMDIKIAREIGNIYNAHVRKQSSADAIPMWILCNPTSDGHPLLLSIQSDKTHFARGIVAYEGSVLLDSVNISELIKHYLKQDNITEDMIDLCVDCKYIIGGMSYGSRSVDELLNAPHGGLTELHCEWSSKTLQTPYLSCKVELKQQVTVGHLTSPCTAIWKSVCALQNINQLLVDITVAGITAVDLDSTPVRPAISGMKKLDNMKRLKSLLNNMQTYTYAAEYPPGGCICISDNTDSLRKCLTSLNNNGSSNDFTYKLWDILRDCNTAKELVTLLIDALKAISSGNIRPFIDANNKTYLGKLVLKLSRGHSQASKVLKNLRSSPAQILSLVAQVAVEKTMWEYTKIISLLEHSFFVAGIWNTDPKETHETIEQLNQSVQDMTMGGELTLNPFDVTNAEQSIRLECEPYAVEDPHELTVDDFASLKKHGVVADNKDSDEVPLITDEIDISSWKTLLMKFAQVHACLEHLYRAETQLRIDFSSLKPIASYLLNHYASEKSPIKTVGQLMSDPVLEMEMSIANIVVKSHLKKRANWYRLDLQRKENSYNSGVNRYSRVVYVLSQQHVFPPSVSLNLESPMSRVAETHAKEELKYYQTKYSFHSNKLPNILPI